jgi:TonB family protein
MPMQFRHFLIPDLLKLWCITLTILIAIDASLGNPSNSQAESLKESFRGSFSRDQSEALESDKNSPISSSLIFTEGTSGEKYAIYAPFFLNLTLRREYLIDGIVVQKKQAGRSKSSDYKRIALSVWPGISSSDENFAVKTMGGWLKKNPDKPLLLIGSLGRPEYSQLKNGQPLNVEGRDQESKLISRVAPVYPQAAKQNRISGTVVLEVLVDEEGIVEQIKPISGHPLLASAAIAAVQHWKYSPTLIDGQAVPVKASVTVIFGLR